MYPYAIVEGEIAELVLWDPGDQKRVVAVGPCVAASPRDQLSQARGLRGPHAYRQFGAALDELSHGAVGDQPPLPDDDEVVGRVLHLAHEMARDEDRAAFGG